MSDAVAILGIGTMGSQIALEYALGGAPVHALARDKARGRAAIGQTVSDAVGTGLWTRADLDQAAARIRVVAGAEELPEVALVVECLPESLEAKTAVLAPIVAKQPMATVATNTSSLSVTALGAAVGAPERTLATHYWNPPLLSPLVEVIPGQQTEQRVLADVVERLRSLGKRPVVLNCEVPGFVWNRLQSALLREALWLVEQGVASTEVLDEIIRHGLAYRYRHIGIFEAVALGGPKTWQQVCANLFPILSDAVVAPDLEAIATLDDDSREALRRRRDDRLAAELKGGNDR